MAFIHCYYSLKRKKIIVEQNMQYLKCEIFELFIRFIFMYMDFYSAISDNGCAAFLFSIWQHNSLLLLLLLYSYSIHHLKM